MKGYFKYTTQLISSKGGGGCISLLCAPPRPLHPTPPYRNRCIHQVRRQERGEKRGKKKVSSAAVAANA